MKYTGRPAAIRSPTPVTTSAIVSRASGRPQTQTESGRAVRLTTFGSSAIVRKPPWPPQRCGGPASPPAVGERPGRGPGPVRRGGPGSVQLAEALVAHLALARPPVGQEGDDGFPRLSFILSHLGD